MVVMFVVVGIEDGRRSVVRNYLGCGVKFGDVIYLFIFMDSGLRVVGYLMM